MQQLIGLFYGLLSMFSPSNNLVFLLKYVVLSFISYLSVLYLPLQMKVNNKFNRRILLVLFLMTIILFMPILLTTISPVDVNYNLEAYIRIFMYIPLYFFIINNKIDLRNYLIKFSYIINAVAIFQMIFLGLAGRVNSLTTHPNFYAIYCSILIIFIVEKLIFGDISRFKKKWYVCYVLLILFLMLFGAGARTSVLSLLLVGLITFLLFGKNKVRNIIIIIIILFLGIIIIHVLHDRLMTLRIFNINYGINEEAEQLNSFDWRIQRWQSAINSWRNSPIPFKIFGYGWESSVEIDYNVAVNYLRGAHIHNEYLRLLIEFGIIGALSFISCLIFLIRKTIRNVKLEGYFSLFMITLYTIITSITENVFVATESFSIVTLSIAVSIGIIYRRKQFNK